ncbi:SpoIIIAC/SpoIIIAD family protein [Sporosarcina sp. JAI121]|uniref:SpoIIIAC/SpoIIIAD family protein n=1 Tax=Sporosarcina sp. JAI121 TaxID=2723064 RepID=UPI0015C8A11C|nr:hypothetical protein [Sporosarcina sp. JAI121]
MVIDDGLMIILVQSIVVFLILLLISFSVPKLQPLLYAAIFFYFLFHLLNTIVFPFGKYFVALFEPLPEPFAKLLIGSAILFYVSELIAKHISEAGYGSLASMTHFAVKIAILTLWMQQTATLIDLLSKLITK